jgi:hypothetical protein
MAGMIFFTGALLNLSTIHRARISTSQTYTFKQHMQNSTLMHFHTSSHSSY